MDILNTNLLDEFFPDIPVPDIPVHWKGGENETLLSTEKARCVLGFEPQYSWRAQDGASE